MLKYTITVMGLFLASCGASETPGKITPPAIDLSSSAAENPQPKLSPVSRAALPPLPELFDCIRKERGMLIAAHRGGPAPGFPENALETMQRTLDVSTPVMEIDVAESQDGVLFLMHDLSLIHI